MDIPGGVVGAVVDTSVVSASGVDASVDIALVVIALVVCTSVVEASVVVSLTAVIVCLELDLKILLLMYTAVNVNDKNVLI